MPRKRIFVEPILCIGCLQCELVCSITKTGMANPANSRIKVTKIEEKGICTPVVCHHCDTAPCQSSCPSDAIYRDTKTWAVVINDVLCINCGECVAACPFGAMQFSAEGSVVKCDLCGSDPLCVRYCQERPENSSAFMSNSRASALQFLGITQATWAKRTRQVQKVERLIE